MSAYFIQKGNHSSLNFPNIISIRKSELRYHIMFTESCKYDIGEDQSDINKLFGIGYLPWHRRNSVRFGWRYVSETNKIEILAYWYISGKRYSHSMCSVDFGKWYDYSIRNNSDSHLLTVCDKYGHPIVTHTIELKPKFFGYKLFPYFGGNKKAPHTMVINMVIFN